MKLNGSDHLLLTRSIEWLTDPDESPTQGRGRRKGIPRSQSADELAAVDFDMFEQRRGSAQNAEMGPDGYMRMQQTSRGPVDMASGAGNVASDRPKGSEQLYGIEEQELTFMAGNGEQNVHILEEWMNATGGEGRPVQMSGDNEPMYSAVGAQLRAENEPIYSQVGAQLRADNDPAYSQVGAQLRAENDPAYSQVGAQLRVDNDPAYSQVGAQLPAENDPAYSQVGAQIRAENEPIYTQVGAQL